MSFDRLLVLCYVLGNCIRRVDAVALTDGRQVGYKPCDRTTRTKCGVDDTKRRLK